jgi:SAM-dependent methyltransferase
MPQSTLATFADIARRILLVATVMGVTLCLIFFPWSVDVPLDAKEQADLQKYYATAYATQGSNVENENSSYVRIANEAADRADITGLVRRFAQQYGLEHKKVLDIGAGRGYLQDVVDDYVGLDISPSAKRFFHKPFILGSATYMPVATNEFDAIWTIWVLEHVPNPEAALVEMRRAVKDGGLLYLLPAWGCIPYAANGYPVRPYSDFGWTGKLVKAFMPFDLWAWGFSKPLTHAVRYASSKALGGPTRLHYKRLTPNYKEYWMSDSDAVNSLDRDELEMWFRTRGDECLNCDGKIHIGEAKTDPLILRVRKPGPAQQERANR